jgi:hypothetical protein
LKDRQKRWGVAQRIGTASNYLDIGTDGALTDAGTQTHSLEALTVATLTPTNTTATIAHVTSLAVGTAASSSGTAQIGGTSNYLSVSAAGALSDTGTQSHDLNVISLTNSTVTVEHVTSLAVGTAASVSGTAQIGGASHYLSVGTDGALTDTGTQAHSLEAVTISTLTNSTLGSVKTRYLHLRPGDFTTNSGASATIATQTLFADSASTQVVRFTVTDPSAADVTVQALMRMPDDLASASALTATLWTSHSTTGGSATAWLLSASAYDNLESTAGTVVTLATADASALSGSAPNVPHEITGTFSASGVAAGDLLRLQLALYCTSGSNRRLESDVYGVTIGYKSLTMY